MSMPRVYVEGLSRVEPDKRTGIVKLTFSAKDPSGPVDAVQIAINVDDLNRVFQTVGEAMQKTFGGGPGPGPGGRGKRPGGRPPLRDLTED